MNDIKVKWSGGRYGECPYITLGDKKYYIQDHMMASGRYEYALMMKKLGEGFDYEFRPNLADTEYGQYKWAVKVFERWYRVKFGSKPLLVDTDTYARRYERGHLAFWVEKPHGKPPRIICRSTGQFVDGWYKSMGECKRCVNRIMVREIEAYNKSQNMQIGINFDAAENENEETEL